MIQRTDLIRRIRSGIQRSRAVVLLGPRQCGKSTLARTLVPAVSSNYFDLEDPASLSRLDQPMTALRELKGLIVIDEIHRRPELFPVLRVLADRKPLPARFLILGSASPDLLHQSSESLAGRLEIVTMSGFHLNEIGWNFQNRHWLRGGFPLSYLARSETDSLAWRKNFIHTLIERDIPQFGIKIPSTTLFRFWSMLAHYHGQVWNAAEPARSLNIGESSVRRYLDLLTDIFMIRQLQPWYINLKKRQVKAPKIYFRDTGLLHQLLGIGSSKELLSHPKCGASWEGYVIDQTIKSLEPDETYFWSTHGGAEIDLLLVKNGKRIGIECKRSDAPRLTPSMKIAMKDLKLKHIVVLYPGERRYKIADHVTAIPIQELSGKANFF